MSSKSSDSRLDRRDFIKASVAVAAAGPAWLAAAQQPAAPEAAKDAKPAIRNERSTMTYRRLGRTEIVSSRLVFGGGAALVGGKAVKLLDRAFEAGVNHFDLGSNVAYRGAEKAIAPFLKAHRNDVWIVSKGPVGFQTGPGESITVEQAQAAAKRWRDLMDASLKDLEVEQLDAYYLMGVHDPAFIRTNELYSAFLEAKTMGKVKYFGLSAHKNAQAVLEAAAETGWYDIAMVGVTPGGWYDWDRKDLVEGTPPLVELQPVLQRARDAGMGLVGMKAARHLAPKLTALGRGDVTAFNKFYDAAFMSAALSPFQRTYAYVLANGLDVVNADMQNLASLEENLVAARFLAPA